LAIPPRSFVIGLPGKVARQTTDDELAWTRNESKILQTKAAKYGSHR